MSFYSNNKSQNTTSMEEEMDLKEVFTIIVRYKVSIAFIVFIITLLAVAYAYFSTSIYQADLTLQTSEQQASTQGSGNRDEFMQQALGAQQNNIDDEISILESNFLARKVLDTVQLGTRYYTKQNFKTVEFYKTNPFTVEAWSLSKYVADYEFDFHVVDANHFSLTVTPSLKVRIRASLRDKEKVINFSEVYTYGELINHQQFNMIINKTAELEKEDYYFTVAPNESMTDLILLSLEVTPASEKGSVITLSYEDNIPKRAEEILTALSNAYKNQNIEVKNTSANKKLSFIDKQLSETNKVLQESASRLQLYKSSHIIIDLKEKGIKLTEKISTLESQVSELDIQKDVLQNLMHQIKSQKDLMGIDAGVSGVEGSSIASLIEKLQQAFVLQSSLTSDYTQKHPSVIKNYLQIESIKESLLGTIDSNLQGIVQRKSILDDNIKRTRAELKLIPEKQKNLANLTNTFSVNQNLYEYLLQKRAETAIVESSKVSNVRIIDKAEVIKIPVKPKRLLIVLIVVVLGVILGVAQALFRNNIANTIQSIPDIEKHTKLPVYAVLPFFKDKKSLYEDTLRVLLTKLEFSKLKPKIITITSSLQGEGRTTTATEFANVIAQSSRKVIIIDFDLRRSKIHTKFNLSNSVGISTLLSGESTIEEVTQSIDTNLDIITAGPTPENTYGLIMSETLTAVMTQLKMKYDYIIIASPSAGIVADALVLMRLSDLNLIVFKAKYSKKDFLKNTNRFVNEHRLENVGIVLNGLDLKNIRPWMKK